MTREEASFYLANMDRKYMEEGMSEALDMAINALEQEPCEDVAKECYEDLCRYFGGAKDILKNREDFKAWIDRIKWHIRKAEELRAENDDLRDQLAMRDRFQKQEPCDDCIRKSTVINILEYHLEHNADVDLTDIIDEIKEEPSIYLNECKDAVRREEVLDLCDSKDPEYNVRFFKEDVECLPPVYPEPKTGHWIRMKAYEKWGCSECNTVFRFTFKEHDYCPNCGAKMLESPEKE